MAERVEKLDEHVKTRRVGNDDFVARIRYNGKNRLQGILFARKDGNKEGEQLFIQDKEELQSLRSLFFKTSCVLARRTPKDYRGPKEEDGE